MMQFVIMLLCAMLAVGVYTFMSERKKIKKAKKEQNKETTNNTPENETETDKF